VITLRARSIGHVMLKRVPEAGGGRGGGAGGGEAGRGGT